MRFLDEPDPPVKVELVRIIRERSVPLAPLPVTCEGADAPALFSGIRAVLLDVYGTLFLSDAGDISLADTRKHPAALARALKAGGFRGDVRAAAARGARRFRAGIEAAHSAARTQGVAAPEVDVREIWDDVMTALKGDRSRRFIETLAVEYECAVNRVWPMPRATETLGKLRASGMALGIVSNAQFFTPLLFDALMGEDLDALGFDAGLCAWSWRLRRAKPGEEIFAPVIETLRRRGIALREALYVGNDMLNDITPAARIGLRTALFAGDRRSLRLRDGDPRCAGVKPDAVITRLDRLLDILTVTETRPDGNVLA